MSPPSREAARALAQAVASGLGGHPKSLPAWMFYDAAGSALYEQITQLDEYYPTRTERAILARHADAIAVRAGRPGEPVTVVELGAGSATKTVLVLRAIARRGPTTFMPVDVSATALDEATARVRAECAHIGGEQYSALLLDLPRSTNSWLVLNTQRRDMGDALSASRRIRLRRMDPDAR